MAQITIEEVKEHIRGCVRECLVFEDDGDAEEIIKALEQQPRTGQWIDKKMTIKGGHGLAYGRYGCSVCKKKQPSKTNFCPNCGADMREREHKE